MHGVGFMCVCKYMLFGESSSHQRISLFAPSNSPLNWIALSMFVVLCVCCVLQNDKFTHTVQH
jgi:hypothetical protein